MSNNIAHNRKKEPSNGRVKQKLFQKANSTTNTIH